MTCGASVSEALWSVYSDGSRSFRTEEKHSRKNVSPQKRLSGGDSKEDPPVPMPNTEVKLLHVDDTWRETAWESR